MRSFVVPDDVGGRFSVLTAVGLLPIAVSGADIRQAYGRCSSRKKSMLWRMILQRTDALQYAAIRNILA